MAIELLLRNLGQCLFRGGVGFNSYLYIVIITYIRQAERKIKELVNVLEFNIVLHCFHFVLISSLCLFVFYLYR